MSDPAIEAARREVRRRYENGREVTEFEAQAMIDAAREALAPIREVIDGLEVDLANAPHESWPAIVVEALGRLEPLIYTTEELTDD